MLTWTTLIDIGGAAAIAAGLREMWLPLSLLWGGSCVFAYSFLVQLTEQRRAEAARWSAEPPRA